MKEAAAYQVQRSASARFWKMRPIDDNKILAITQRHQLPEIIARLLCLRGVALDDVPHYLSPKLRDIMPDPLSLRDMDKAVSRLATAIEQGETIAVFGDYDVDGATSSAILYHYLSALGLPPRLYIPDRQTEGYGPNHNAFSILKEEGHNIIVCVDCGTMAHDVLAKAKADGTEIIVIDHHQSGGGLPSCAALINPRRADDDSGLDYLAAVGVVFFVVVGLHRELRKRGFFDEKEMPDLMGYLDLVALGTVCDVVPLQGVNRAFVQQGIKVLQGKNSNMGLGALARAAKSEPPYGTYEMGFQLGPRLNAGGRVGQANLGVRLLTSDDAEELVGIAARLDDFNKQRQSIEKTVLAESLAMVETKIGSSNTPPPFLLVANEDWHIGVVGIVASRLKDRYHRPSFVLGFNDGKFKGSVRSISGVDIGRMVATAVDNNIIEGGGGHAMAAGVTLTPAQLPAFESYLAEALEGKVQDTPKELMLDGSLTPKAATRDFYESLQEVGPFGAGNAEPCFALPDVRIIKATIVGDQHVRCIISGIDGGSLKAMAFASVPEDVRHALLQNPYRAHIAGTLRPDDWNGKNDTQFFIRDIALP
ncbi:MAG: single-stranded-DNA-specific exonuclease RecJ [Alphaproteobacteria bacterium]|nr:single-stranded-DNA-specific exonuclease RecJ [Alphaproteobacteria bacterium]